MEGTRDLESLVTFTTREAAIADAIFECMYPADEGSPGAAAIGVLSYVDRALADAYADVAETYRLGLAALDLASTRTIGCDFTAATPKQRRALLTGMERGRLKGFATPDQSEFFSLLLAHCQEGLFADPAYGGNRDKRGWASIGHPGVWLEHTAEENLSAEPVTKGGRIQSLADLGYSLGGTPGEAPPIPGYDPDRGVRPPGGKVDVLLIGVGAVGGVLAPMFAEAGLRVVGLEAGPYRQPADYIPDELGAAYYCRQNMGGKFMSEQLRWRTAADAPTTVASYSLGRMMNGVGGSLVHYGGWLRRFHPHHFRYRSYLTERYGEGAIPEGCTVADWLVGYDELEPHFTRLEAEIGVAGDAAKNPFLERSRPFPLPEMRPSRMGEAFREATEALGLHPYPVPAGMTTRPHNGFPETKYSGWDSGFGAREGDKWHPGLTSVPRALATGNFDLRTGCRVLRVVTGADGRATGAEYVDRDGVRHIQEAEVVVLSAYTWENLRLLFLSGDDKRPDGLGNTGGQLGRHVMVKMFSHVDGSFPDRVFNRHTGPAAQSMVLDDYVSTEFDALAHGFVGGATLGAENQFLPIQISRETLPPDVPRWGAKYKRHIRDWQHLGVVRIQSDALPYHANYVDIDPTHTDTSGFAMPVLRATYDLQANERAANAWFQGKGEEILKGMGAAKTWRGPAFTGLCSSHDTGGARMSEDPAAGVVDRDLQVHDTPGLYVMSMAAYPSCPGVNPTLTLWALCSWAAERLIDRLKRGEEG